MICDLGIAIAIKEAWKKRRVDFGDSKSRKYWWYQFFAVFSVSSSCISCGNFLGYTSTAIPSMEKDLLTFPAFSAQAISLIGGLGPLGALLGSLLTLVPFRWLGPRRTIGIFGIPAILSSWLIIGFCSNLNFVFAARFLGGIGCGFIISCAPLYVIDISSVTSRGQLGIMPQFLMILGILVSYILGSFLPWNYLAQACACLLVPSALLIIVAPDPPGWLISRGHTEKALRVLETLNGSKQAGDALLEIQSRLQNQGLATSSRWNKGTLKAGLVSLGLISVQQLTGINGITFFALSIFNHGTTPSTTNEISGNIPAIVLASTQLVASFMSTLFVEEFGRKGLITISALIISISGTLLGCYFYFYPTVPILEQLNWIPLVTLVIFAFGFAIGLGPVTWILVTEILPQETRHLMNPVIIAYNWFCVFIVTSSFPLLREEIHYFGIFWAYAVIAFVGVIFIRVFVPETKGKTQAEILTLFHR